MTTQTEYDEALRLERWVHEQSMPCYQPGPDYYDDTLIALGWASEPRPRLISPFGWTTILLAITSGGFLGLIWMIWWM